MLQKLDNAKISKENVDELEKFRYLGTYYYITIAK